MKRLLIAATIVAAASPAWAGSTTLKSSLTALTDRCGGTNCTFNSSVPCGTNADCALGSFSTKSKASISGTGQLNIKLKDAVDAAAMPASGDYIAYVVLVGTLSGTAQQLAVKVPVADGTGNVTADLSSFLLTSEAVVSGINIFGPPDVPDDCPGDNSAAAILARVGDPDCTSGTILGAIGLLTGSSKTKEKSNAVPVPDSCSGMTCQAHVGEPCMSNIDCYFGQVSPKSKASVSGDGKLTITLKGVLDAVGAPASGAYIVRANYALASGASGFLPLEVIVESGKGKASADLGSFFEPADVYLAFGYNVYAPPDVPGDCPGGNAPADIMARSSDPDCFTGSIIALKGIIPGL